MATVYRTVKLLLTTQQIHVLRRTARSAYESAHLDHHHHFRCRKCEQVYDLPGCPLAIADGTKLPAGFEVDAHEVTLFGTCPSCRPGKRSEARRLMSLRPSSSLCILHRELRTLHLRRASAPYSSPLLPYITYTSPASTLPPGSANMELMAKSALPSPSMSPILATPRSRLRPFGSTAPWDRPG